MYVLQIATTLISAARCRPPFMRTAPPAFIRFTSVATERLSAFGNKFPLSATTNNPKSRGRRLQPAIPSFQSTRALSELRE